MSRRLSYPKLDETLVAKLVPLADELDDIGSSGRDDPGKRAEFNALAGTSLDDPLDFHFSGACSAELFVRDVLARQHVDEFSGLADEELLVLIREISAGERADEGTFWLAVLDLNLPGSVVSDLIFWPDQALARLGITDVAPDSLSAEDTLRISRSVAAAPPILLPASSLSREDE